MFLMKDMPSSGAPLRSSVHRVQVGGCGGSPGRANSFANAPSNTPLRSTNRNQPTDLPASSFFSQRPATVGSAARTAGAALANATRLATSKIDNRVFNGVTPHVRPTHLAQQYAHFRASNPRNRCSARRKARDFVAISPRSATLAFRSSGGGAEKKVAHAAKGLDDRTCPAVTMWMDQSQWLLI